MSRPGCAGSWRGWWVFWFLRHGSPRRGPQFAPPLAGALPGLLLTEALTQPGGASLLGVGPLRGTAWPGVLDFSRLLPNALVVAFASGITSMILAVRPDDAGRGRLSIRWIYPATVDS